MLPYFLVLSCVLLLATATCQPKHLLNCNGVLQVWILCNDCNRTCKVFYHILGHKCSSCNSYNTRKIAAPDDQIAAPDVQIAAPDDRQ